MLKIIHKGVAKKSKTDNMMRREAENKKVSERSERAL